MIIVQLNGGLGNQMFQYAAGRALSLIQKTELKLDVSFLLDRSPRQKGFVYRDFDLNIFNLPVNFASKEELSLLNKKILANKTIDRIVKKAIGKKITYFKEPHFHFYRKFFSLGANLYLDGYWQSEKYFKDHSQVIRQDFTFKNKPQGKTLDLLNKIKSENAVCVNVRRGDFITTPLHGILDTGYYKTAENLINEKVSSPYFYVFSDDIGWCREHLTFSGPTNYVSHDFAGEKFQEYLQLMIQCKHFIIPNSSFGWWAAWLNNNPEKIVIAPKRWFNKGPKDTQDLIPETWIQI